MYHREKGRFTAADINGDGLLDDKEWLLFHNPLKDEAIQNAAIEESMPHVDRNSDDKISFDEYVNDFREKVKNEKWIRHKILIHQFLAFYEDFGMHIF